MLVKQNKSQQGVSLIEVTIVAFLLMVVLVALVSVTTMAIARNRSAKEKAVATRLAQQTAEWLRYDRDRRGFAVLAATMSSGDTITACLPTLPDTMPTSGLGCNFSTEQLISKTFTRQISITAVGTPVTSLNYTITVAWHRSGSIDDKVVLNGVLSEWEK